MATPPEQWFAEKTVIVPIGNMYIRPAESASVVDTLKQGDRITVIGREGEWYMARLPDQRLGWVHESLFRELPEENTDLPEPPPPPPSAEQQIQEEERLSEKKSVHEFQAEVKVPSARIRENPSLSSDVNFGLQKGEKVTVMAREKNWYHIRSGDGRTGWGFHSLFRIPDEADELPAETAVPASERKTPDGKLPFQAVTKIEMARIRENPSFEADVLFRIKKGKKVTVTDVKDDWFRIENEEGKSGWAHHLHFSRLPSAVGTSPVISSIRFETDSDESEKVIIALNSFHPPDETFPLDEEIPKVVCDFYEVSVADGIDRVISVNGKMIHTIRLGIHKGSRPKVRVVVDLDPQKKYSVEQVFFKKDNLYTLIFKPITG
ncbi:MAG: SH3 domain-containing protein [Desulfococcaceae bacterium]